jgi:fucose permease
MSHDDDAHVRVSLAHAQMTTERSGSSTSRRRAANIVYAAGLAQGIVLVTFPAASTIFTDPARYDLSNTQFGTMFAPQVVMAITAAILGSALAGRIGRKRVYLLGLACSLLSMILLIASQFMDSEQAVAYPLLLVATAFLGAGFGLTVPALNTFTAAFHPHRIDASILTLNALLGLGTALAPAFVAVFVGLGFWWGLPVASACLLVALLVASMPLPLETGDPATAAQRERGGRLPARFWLFAAFVLLYGFCETMNGNWAQIDMTEHLGASATMASLALTAFWAMVTVGRVAFELIQRWLPTPVTYRVLPFVLAATFVGISLLPDDSPGLGVLAFALAGLGCSALLPLTISFAQEQLVRISASVAGGVIAFYQVGYGIAAFGAGPLQDAGVTLPAIFGFTAAVAVAMGALGLSLGRQPR